jgi:hypothetical protein
MISNARHVTVERDGFFYVIPLYKLPEWKKIKGTPDWAIKAGTELEKIDFGSYVIRDS